MSDSSSTSVAAVLRFAARGAVCAIALLLASPFCARASSKKQHKVGSTEARQEARAGNKEHKAASAETRQQAHAGGKAERAASAETRQQARAGSKAEKTASAETRNQARAGSKAEKAASAENRQQARAASKEHQAATKTVPGRSGKAPGKVKRGKVKRSSTRTRGRDYAARNPEYVVANGRRDAGRGGRGEERPASAGTAAKIHAWERQHRAGGDATYAGGMARGSGEGDSSNAAGSTAEAGVPQPLRRSDLVQSAEVRPIAPETQEADSLEFAEQPMQHFDPVLFNKRGRLIMPPALKGSHYLLVRQNTVANREGLARVQDDDDLLQLRREKQLVALPMSSSMRVDERLPENRRYCRPWTERFLVEIGRAHYARFHQPLQVNSAVRTVAFQRSLRRTNGNAAPFEGDTASPHLTGATIDIAKHGLSMTEIAWMRGYLLPLEQEGKIDVEEEFQQSVFHISVYKNYLPYAPSARHQKSSALLAVGVR